MSIRITQNADFSVCADQSRYCLAIVNKYLNHATVPASEKRHDRFLPCDMTFTKKDASENDVQVKELMRKFNLHYRACIGALIYLTATRVDISFPVSKLAKYSACPGKRHFMGLVHLLRYLRDNSYLGLKYYANPSDAPLSDLLRGANISTSYPVVAFSDSSWQDCPDTGRSTGCYIVFYQGGPVDHSTHVPTPVAQSSAESEYNAACTGCMALAHFRMMNSELEGKKPDEIPSDPPLMILDSRAGVDMSKNDRDSKQTRHIARRMHFVRQGEAQNLHRTTWIEGDLQLADIGTKNVRADELQPRLGYIMVKVDP